MNQNIVDLLKKIRIQTKTIEGGYMEFSIRETEFYEGWYGYQMHNSLDTVNVPECSLCRLFNDDEKILVCVKAPKGSRFYRNMCVDADTLYQVGIGKLYDSISETYVDVDNNISFTAGTLHEFSVEEDSIFTILYTNIR